MEFAQILEGWRNKLLPPKDLKELIEKVYQERIEICRGCPFFSENRKKEGYKTKRPDEHCTNCGCTSAAKNRCLSCECPLEGEEKKWYAITTQEEYDGIKRSLEGSENQESSN